MKDRSAAIGVVGNPLCKRIAAVGDLLLFPMVITLFLATLGGVSWAQPPTQEQRSVTKNYLLSLQTPDGGFRVSAEAGPSDLGATSSALRALGYLGGEIKNKADVEKFIIKFAHESGGFCEKIGEKPDVRNTWFGTNALVNLRGSAPENAKKVLDFVTENAKSLYPDIYFAAATLEDLRMQTPEASKWIAAFEANRKQDGSYGEGAADTAHAVVVLFRLGGTLKDPASAAKVMKASQTPSGGFEGKGGAVNMPNTYTVMRALMMLKEKSDIEALYRYLASCRNPDGGYGVAPAKPSNITFTYFASAVLHWADQMKK